MKRPRAYSPPYRRTGDADEHRGPAELTLAATAALTMTSLEIAECTGKRHADVLRDIRTMLEQLGEDERRFASVYRAGNGEGRPCFALPKRECLILVSGYSVTLRAAIIDRWQELEAAQARPALPTTFAEALRLAVADAQTVPRRPGRAQTSI